jgi:hypothetical protein
VVTFDRPADRAAELRGRPGAVRFLELPPRRCAMIDGTGPPGPAAFEPRMPGLYSTAWTLRFALKARDVITKVGPLEGLWWTADETTDLDAILGPDRGTWRWTLLIVLPDEATDGELEAALETGRTKLDDDHRPSLRIETLDEGRVAQLMHVGPYSTERASIDRLHAGVAEAGLQVRGRHHEIYLGNPRSGAPERLRTVLRHPVR